MTFGVGRSPLYDQHVIGDPERFPAQGLALRFHGQRLDRHGAGRIVRGVARRAGIPKNVSPHTLRHAFITAALDAGVPLRDVQEAASHADPRTTGRYGAGWPGRWARSWHAWRTGTSARLAAARM